MPHRKRSVRTTGQWSWCYWCWQRQYDMQLLNNRPLCNRCVDLDEPPWRPHNVDRCGQYLQHILREVEAVSVEHARIAAFLAHPFVA